MIDEHVSLIFIGNEIWEREFRGIEDLVLVAARRHAKAEPGEQREGRRFSEACAEIERRALLLDNGGATTIPARLLPSTRTTREPYSWYRDPARLGNASELSSLAQRLSRSEGVVVEIRRPLSGGPRLRPASDPTRELPPVAERWKSPTGATGMRAARELFHHQLQCAVSGTAPIVPTSVRNRVLTEELRIFVSQMDGVPPVDARVVYDDGSEAEPFPLRSLVLPDAVPTHNRIIRVALLSFRHPEMDTHVQACWLRNRDISVVRSTAETDSVVTRRTISQLKELARSGPFTIELFQTGFEPAIVGFYRAFVRFAQQQEPGFAHVLPQCYRRDRKSYDSLTPWGRAQ